MNDHQRKAAFAAWQAYNAMETTKQRHFDLLTVFETKKKKFNINPTAQDSVLLQNLLRDHDEQVKVFTQASTELKHSDGGAHSALFEYIGHINNVLGAAKTAH